MMRTAQHRPNRAYHGSLAAHVLVAQEAERRRVSREIHDDLAQKVALLQFQIEEMKRRLISQPQVLLELESLRGCVAMLAKMYIESAFAFIRSSWTISAWCGASSFYATNTGLPA